MDIEISKDKSRLDIAYMQAFLTKAYWAKGRTIEEVRVTVENSVCYAIFLNNEQIGFARVVTDFTVFAYLMDVFIDEKHRGKSYSTALMDFIMNDHELAKVKIWRLATTDAAFLYRKFGFTPLKNPEKMMEKIVDNK